MMRTMWWIGVGATAVALVTSDLALAQEQSKTPPSRQETRSLRRPNLNGVFQREYDSKILMGQRAQTTQFELADGVAKCLMRRNDTAGDLLGGAMTSDPEYGKLVKALKSRYSRCASPEAAGIPVMMINGALAEELVKAGNPTLDDRAKAVNVSTAEPFYTDPSGRSMDTVGRCLAVYSPGLAMRVLKANIASPAEKEALSVLYAKTPECGQPAPPTNFSSQEQRSAVAVGLYHWLHRS